ncbi:MAG: Uma2 family endonuclease, partial [Planctomycetia bacterium]|nr:Uma2 family endonuclease [Planctomycetia bacterium]
MQSSQPFESALGDPTWEIAELFPRQGYWSECEYLLLQTNRLIELSNGKLEVLQMPSQSHQFIALFLYRQIYSFVSERKLGSVAAAPLRVRLWAGTIREPDVAFMLESNKAR